MPARRGLSLRRSGGAMRGFTLVEVLVALGVIALVMPALLLALRERVDSTAYLRDQTLANWVAANRLVELRLARARPAGSGPPDNSGISEMAGRRWAWRVEQQDTGVEGFVRLDIRVQAEDEPGNAPLSVLTGFLRASPGQLSAEGD